MSFLISIFSIMFGYLFIAIGLGDDFPLLKRINMFHIHEGIITAIEESEKGTMAKVQYEKQGKTCEGSFCFEKEFGSMFSISFKGYVGMKVGISLNGNGSIEQIIMGKDDEKKDNEQHNKKWKIKWGSLLFGIFLFVYGLYSSIRHIIRLFV